MSFSCSCDIIAESYSNEASFSAQETVAYCTTSFPEITFCSLAELPSQCILEMFQLTVSIYSVLSKVGLKLRLKCVRSCLIQKTNIANIVCNLCLMKHNEQVIKLVNVIPLYFKWIYSKEKKEPVLGTNCDSRLNKVLSGGCV